VLEEKLETVFIFLVYFCMFGIFMLFVNLDKTFRTTDLWI